jgi:hypothetical protein
MIVVHPDIGFGLPNDFPFTPYLAVNKLLRRLQTNDQAVLARVREYGAGWNSIAYRYRACAKACHDQACGFNLVLAPDAFKSRLKQLLVNAADPPVPNVQTEAFPDPSEGGKGFVVCHIPESPYKPHRAEASGRRWLMRIGDNFVDIPPSVLRSLFYPHRNSYALLRLAGRMQTVIGGAMKNVAKLTMQPRLYNEGPATLDSLFVLVKDIQGMSIGIPREWSGGRSSTGWRIEYPSPVHPGQMAELPIISIEMSLDENKQAVVDPKGLVLQFQMYAHDLPPFGISISYSEAEVRSPSEKVGLPEPIEIERFRS